MRHDAICLKRHFDAEIIVLCVYWYVTHKLSYRDLAAMMVERAVIDFLADRLVGFWAPKVCSRPLNYLVEYQAFRALRGTAEFPQGPCRYAIDRSTAAA